MRSVALALLASSIAALSCAALIGLDPGVPRDAGADVDNAGRYSDLTDPNAWTTFDLQPLIGRGQGGFIGGVFDGRYVYFAPGAAMSIYHDTVFRYDTTAQFGLSGSWSSYALGQMNMNARGYFGAVRHGNTVVFVPYGTTLAAFYDTTKPLDAGFALRTPPAQGFIGAVSDGHAIHFVPHYANAAYHGTAVRWQDAGPEAGPWSQVNFAQQVDMSAVGFFGGVFDGRYVYYAPFVSPLVVRYDTTAPYADAGSFRQFDLRSLRSDATGYTGGGFDGRYVYLVPRGYMAAHGLVARFDTNGAIEDKLSWQIFDITQVSPAAKQFSGAAFDGKYMYFVPATTGLVVRFDTTASFGAITSWSAFDVATKTATARGYQGAVFDGQYIYLVPNQTSVAVRFDARTPPLLPAFYNGGSFL